MRNPFSQNLRLLLGGLLNGFAVFALALFWAPAAPLAIPLQWAALLPMVHPIPWPAFAALAGVASSVLWLFVFRSLLTAFARMTQAVEPAARDVGLGVTFKAGDELSHLEHWIYAQKQRLELSEEKNRLLIADVAHELCSPLARMQRALSLAERHIGVDALPYMQKVENELQHVARLVEEVLSFSQTTRQPNGEKADRFPLQDLVDEILAREASAGAVQSHVPEGLHLTTRRKTLDRALSNLVRNAVRYAGDSGLIEICAEESPSWVTLSVKDNGPGLPAELLEKIFQPFYRPDSARQRRTGGAGLGLAIVRSCTEACGGSVKAHLRNPKGLEFQIRLPHLNEPQPAAPDVSQTDGVR